MSASVRSRLGILMNSSLPEARTVDASPLAVWLIKALARKGWSVPELARKAGLSAPGVYRIQSGVSRNLREETRKKLESVLGPVPSETAAEVAEEAEVQGLGKLEDFDPHVDSERPTEA